MPYLTAGIHNGAPVELYYEDNRTPGTTGDPVVLIHGWLRSGRT
jgi:pimeloyl-ACP methyl ester carboxylesterase